MLSPALSATIILLIHFFSSILYILIYLFIYLSVTKGVQINRTDKLCVLEFVCANVKINEYINQAF